MCEPITCAILCCWLYYRNKEKEQAAALAARPVARGGMTQRSASVPKATGGPQVYVEADFVFDVNSVDYNNNNSGYGGDGGDGGDYGGY